jgi:hypothetical protein
MGHNGTENSVFKFTYIYFKLKMHEVNSTISETATNKVITVCTLNIPDSA